MIISLTLVVSALILNGASWHITLTDPVIDTFFQLHNEARGRLGVPPLRWNQTLSTYAETICVDCLNVNQSQYGQNVARVFSRKLSPQGKGEDVSLNSDDMDKKVAEKAVLLWFEERRSVDLDWKCIRKLKCGHFSQMAWKDTTDIGCAIIRCPLYENVVICEYSPRGNILGEKPF